MDFGTQMSANREQCVPSVVFLEENHGLVLAKGPIVAVPNGFWHTNVSPQGAMRAKCSIPRGKPWFGARRRA